MIVTKLISGLGNQLFQYAIGRQLSLAKEVPLKLDLSFFKSQDLRSYKLNHYHINAEIATTADIVPFRKEINRYQKLHQQTSFFAKVYRNVEPVLFPKHTKNYFKEHIWWILEPDVFKTPANVYVEGYWQHYKYFENVQPQIFEELTLKEPLDTKAAAWLSAIKTDKSSVAVHIRRGDYVTDSNANYLMGVLPMEYYQKAIHYLKQKVSKPSFYFFSDDLEWVKENIKTDAATYYVDGNTDYVDLDLMRQCSNNIIANSTFSWWGAFLNRNPNKIVIAPEKWSAREDVNKSIQLQFPSWIKL
ncbi:alpha-1,2-fucosyltransferase [Mucilaginibacter arboris]|uniref:alpha-1,2-fucosyltransferase n=1 Tax=Mucilaginibacter arboris TaxID=2682090 RepID=UPI0012FCED2F|nr:alpha-1,2-fucosyltransferase [Mucilaginibacter arboris]